MPKLYLDNCCFNRPFDDQSQVKIFLESQAKLYIQQLIIEGYFELVWSYILDYENQQNPFEMRKYAILKWKDVSSPIITESESIIETAESYFRKGIKPKDALHLACAKEADCDYFLTTDRKLLRAVIEGLTILSPIELVERMGETNED